MDDYEFEFTPDAEDENLTKASAATAKCLKFLIEKLSQAREDLLCGMQNNFLKTFTFTKFLIQQISELQDICVNPANIRPGDVDKKIESVLSHVEEYSAKTPSKNINNTQKTQDKPAKKDDNDESNDYFW